MADWPSSTVPVPGPPVMATAPAPLVPNVTGALKVSVPPTGAVTVPPSATAIVVASPLLLPIVAVPVAVMLEKVAEVPAAPPLKVRLLPAPLSVRPPKVAA